MTIPLLVATEISANARRLLQEAGFALHEAPKLPDRPAVIAAAGGEVRAVLTNGSLGLSEADIGLLPKLEIICAMGAGFENIHLPSATARGIVVTNGAGTNDAAVADHAMLLAMASLRGLRQSDAAVRRGEWATSRAQRPGVSGRRMGILGLGHIGRQIARRAEAGFGMEVAYHSRNAVADVAWTHMPDARALAAWAEVLVVATPGGAGTRHMVDAAVLAALGPEGHLVNIARGSVVDTQALIAALQSGGIAGAALDVLEGEPEVPEALLALENVVLTPHMAGRSPEAMAATAALAVRNLRAHFDGADVVNRVA